MHTTTQGQRKLLQPPPSYYFLYIVFIESPEKLKFKRYGSEGEHLVIMQIQKDLSRCISGPSAPLKEIYTLGSNIRHVMPTMWI